MNNGLRGADREVFKMIQQAETRLEISNSTLAYITGYHPKTIGAALRRLAQRGYIERQRHCPGRPYTYNVCRKQNGAG